MILARLSIVFTVLSLAACSSNSDGGSDPQTNTTTTFPASFDSRIRSRSIDIDKDGSIDDVERFSYDEQGRILSKITENASGSTSTVSYLYFEDDLIEIDRGRSTEKYGYQNDQVVSYNFIHKNSADFNRETLFLYDESGRLTGTVGETYVFDESECRPTPTSLGSTNEKAPAELTISYSGTRLSNIKSDNGEYEADYTYNSANQLTGITQQYSCDDVPEITKLRYDSNSRLVFYEQIYDRFEGTIQGSKIEISYDEFGRAIKVLDEEYGFTGISTTQQITYDERDRPILIDYTTIDPNPGLFLKPSFTVTIEYEEKTCLAAITADPLTKATLDTFARRIRRNDPAICTYPLN